MADDNKFGELKSTLIKAKPNLSEVIRNIGRGHELPV